jgi:hypothetical protein
MRFSIRIRGLGEPTTTRVVGIYNVAGGARFAPLLRNDDTVPGSYRAG